MATIRISVKKPVQPLFDRSALNAIVMSAGQKQGAGKVRSEIPDLAALLEKAAGTRPAAGAAAEETVSLTGASDETKVQERATPVFIAAAYLLVILGAVLGGLLATTWAKPSGVIKVVDGLGFFAIFYLAAQAIERLVEPLTALNIPDFGSVNKKKEEAKRNQNRQKAEDLLRKATTAAETAEAQKAVDDSAANDAKKNQIKNNTDVLVWGAATFVAMLASGAMGLYLLKAVGVEVQQVWLDVAVSGLAIGAGTKPLHELITYMKNKNEAADDEGGGSEE